MRRYLILLLVLLLAMVPLAVLAQDDDDNECRDGGLLSRADGNGCESDWAWTCGWYLDNWLDNGGWANENNFFPDWCAPESLLPPQPSAEEIAAAASGGLHAFPSGGCVTNGFGDWIQFGGSYFLPVGSPVYDNGTCTNQDGVPLNVSVVYAPAPYDAETLCKAAFGASAFVSDGPLNDIYGCTVP